jgi:dihydroorotate dehydrogenase
LRNLQHHSALSNLLDQLQQALKTLAYGSTPKPLFLKIAPDLTNSQLSELLNTCEAHKVSGIIATNTTLDRNGLAAAEKHLAPQAGGLSGKPLTKRARNIVALIHRETGGQLPIIGVGGIMTVDDGLRMLDAGASLIQVYTGLVYAGVGLVHAINRALLQR